LRLSAAYSRFVDEEVLELYFNQGDDDSRPYSDGTKPAVHGCLLAPIAAASRSHSLPNSPR